MAVSIVDVAAHAGVSKTTVSAVINGHQNVKAATREKVLRAIEELDYHPNLAARELITANKTNIGVLLPAYRHGAAEKGEKYFPYINEASNYDVVSKLIDALSQSGYGLMTEHVEIGAGEMTLPSFATLRRVAGVLHVTPLFDSKFLHRLQKYVPHIVQIGNYTAAFDCVYSDYTQTVRQTVDYLCAYGHRRIAFINADPASSTAVDRLQGYKEGLMAHGIAYTEELVRSVPFTGLDGYRAFADIWEKAADKPSAVITSTEVGACGVLRYMHERGYQVPRDLSVISNEDGLACETTWPTLTVLGRNKEKIAAAAARVMLDRLKNPDVPHIAQRVEDELIERGSVRSI